MRSRDRADLLRDRPTADSKGEVGHDDRQVPVSFQQLGSRRFEDLGRRRWRDDERIDDEFDVPVHR
jgi:hypothetical protein